MHQTSLLEGDQSGHGNIFMVRENKCNTLLFCGGLIKKYPAYAQYSLSICTHTSNLFNKEFFKNIKSKCSNTYTCVIGYIYKVLFTGLLNWSIELDPPKHHH